ncbi:unannotated protein [freshwater metagenome]|uniref:Unannotated protein n=1 Tax=freshwater metagenome TaxID=449393 RepID=A0A6J7DXK6_9ZZZZ
MTDLSNHIGQVLIALGCALIYQLFDFVKHLWIQRPKGKIFQFPFDRIHSQAMSKWGIDFEGFLRLCFLLVNGKNTERAHVVQAISKFDYQDSDISRHGNDHFANSLGLGCLAVAQLVQLGYAVDKFSDLIAKSLSQFLKGIVRILNSVVQQCCDQHRYGHPQISQNFRHLNRVSDVGLPRFSGLSAMTAFCNLKGQLQVTLIGFGVMLTNGLRHGLKFRRGNRTTTTARQAGEP